VKDSKDAAPKRLQEIGVKKIHVLPQHHIT